MKPIKRSTSHSGLTLLLVFGLLAVGIIGTGTIYYWDAAQHYRTEVERKLSAIAELKVGELVQWREERLSHASVFFKNPSFTALVRRFLEQPADADAHRQLLDWLGKYPATEDYDRIRLLDVQGVTRLSLPADPKSSSLETLFAVAEALRSGKIVIEDFNRHQRSESAYLSVIVPIFDELDANRPMGALVMRIEPERYFFPFIKRWPTPSPTAETLLVCRDGSDLLYLNNLRHQTNAVFAMRCPLTRTNVPSVRVVLGQTGIMEGVDYRGVPVISIGRAISNSPWFLMAKMDLAEVYGPLRERLWQIIVLISALLFAAGACVWLVWRRQRMVLAMMENLPDYIYLKDKASRFLCVNLALAKRFGVSEPSQAVGKTDADFLSEERARNALADEQKILSTGQSLTEVEEKTVHPDGRESWELTTKLALRDGAGRIIGTCGISSDITGRKRTEEKLAQLNAQYKRVLLSIEEGILSLDLQGNHTYVNPAAAKMLGYEPQELIDQHNHSTWCHAKAQRQHLPKRMCRICAVYQDGMVQRSSTEVFWRKDGTSFPVEYASMPIFEQGKIVGAVVTFMEITARKQAENELRAHR